MHAFCASEQMYRSIRRAYTAQDTYSGRLTEFPFPAIRALFVCHITDPRLDTGTSSSSSVVVRFPPPFQQQTPVAQVSQGSTGCCAQLSYSYTRRYRPRLRYSFQPTLSAYQVR